MVGSGNSLLITSKQFTSRTWARTLTTAWSSSLKLQTGMAYRMLYNTPDKQKRISLHLDQMRTCFTGWIWKKKDVPLMNVIHFSIQSRLTYCWHSNVSRVASYRSTMRKPSAFFKTLIKIIIAHLFHTSLKIHDYDKILFSWPVGVCWLTCYFFVHQQADGVELVILPQEWKGPNTCSQHFQHKHVTCCSISHKGFLKNFHQVTWATQKLSSRCIVLSHCVKALCLENQDYIKH